MSFSLDMLLKRAFCKIILVWTITNKWIASRAGWTPYDGVRVTGWPVGTFVRGRRVMWQGELVTPSLGEPIRFLETLRP